MNPTVQKSGLEGLFQKLAASRFLTISAFLHVLLILLFGGTVLFNKYVEPPDFTAEGDFLQAGPADLPPAPEPMQQMPTPDVAPPPPTVTPPAASLAMITSSAPSATGLVIPVSISAPSMAKSISEMAPVAAVKPSASGALPGLPAAMAGRSGSGRSAALQSQGGKQASEQAVVSALRWLQKVQNPDGTWGNKHKVAMTGLGLLCFLGHGETPAVSREFGIVVDNAIKALIAQAGKDEGRLGYSGKGFGAVGPPVYSHAIATYALGEAASMTKDEKITPVVAKAIDYILQGQGSDGGWMYGYNKATPSDSSVTGWQIQALKAAKIAGIGGDGVHAAMEKGVKSIEAYFNPKNGSFGYRKIGDRDYSLTGVGVLCKLFTNPKPDKMIRDAIKNIESREVKYDSAEADLYAWYYNTQACFQSQGGVWERWNRRFQDEIVKSQSPDGSWPPTGNAKMHGQMNEVNPDANVYRTALCTLMLEVYYRYLPTSKETSEAPKLPTGL